MRKLFVVMVLALIMLMGRHARANNDVGMVEMQESADINPIAEKLSSDQVVDFGMLMPDTTPLAAALLEYDDELHDEVNTAVDINHEVLEPSSADTIDTTSGNKQKRAAKKLLYHPSIKDKSVFIDPEYVALHDEVDEALTHVQISHEFTQLSIQKLLDLIELEIALIDQLLVSDKDKNVKVGLRRPEKALKGALPPT